MATETKGGRLTVAKVKSAGPGKYHDRTGTGLLLRVDPNGARFWIQRITVYGKRRELGLGAWPVVTLADAREAALENKRIAYHGGDPLAERRRARDILTFADAVDRYLASKLDEFKNEKHKKQWRSTLDAYARPVLGSMPVRAIAVADVLRVLEPVWTSKTETASRLRGRIEQVLAWATVAGHREGDNPARWRGNLDQLLPKPSKVADSGNQPALSLRDAPRWWAALRERDGMAARALEFLALTAARSGEVRGMTWDEVTTEGGEAIWTIPAARMKMGKTHRVPLSAQAVALLEKLPRLDGSLYVFFAPKGGSLSDMALSAAMRRLQEADVRAGGVGYLDTENRRPAVPHGLRSTFRQWAAEQGFPSDMAEIALAHARDSEVERAYQRSDLIERRRAMMAAWAGYLAREDRQGNVIRLDKSAV